MERLDLFAEPQHSTQESAIHLARYSNIVHLVKDKVVLDIACGEGYGSALLMRAGARKVVGIDISSETINKCKEIFRGENVDYIQHDASQIDKLFEPDTFDVVISIETIEHVEDDEKYLSSLKKVAKKDAIFFISCPNDNWYYKDPAESNPFHLRKYSLADFQSVTKKVFGDNVKWALGSATFGYGSVPLNNNEFDRLGRSWLRALDSDAGPLICCNDKLDPVNEENCSYFMGMWNVEKFPYGSSFFGVGMDSYSRMFDALAYDSIASFKKAIEDSNNNLYAEKQEVRRKSVLLLATQAENKAIRDNVRNLMQENRLLAIENNEMKVGYWRYRRISEAIPPVIRRNLVKIFKKIKGE